MLNSSSQAIRFRVVPLAFGATNRAKPHFRHFALSALNTAADPARSPGSTTTAALFCPAGALRGRCAAPFEPRQWEETMARVLVVLLLAAALAGVAEAKRPAKKKNKCNPKSDTSCCRTPPFLAPEPAALLPCSRPLPPPTAISPARRRQEKDLQGNGP